MNTDNNSISNDEAMDPQSAPVEMNSGNVHDAAQQLETSISRFAQEDEGNQESLFAVMKQAGAQLRTTDAKEQRNRAEIDKLASRIRNYRS